jgi:imidazolonepropionase-like amidohydrolase
MCVIKWYKRLHTRPLRLEAADMNAPFATSERLTAAVKRLGRLMLLGPLLFVASVFTHAHAAEEITVLAGATVIGGIADAPLENAVVVIRNDRIDAIARQGDGAVPAGARVVDISGKWLIPGLVDAHVHFFQSGGLYTRPDVIDLRHIRPYEEEIDRIRERLPETLERYLASGITSVVDLAGPGWTYELRALASDTTASPRVMLSGPGLTAQLPAGLDGKHAPAFVVHSPEEARASVRRLAAQRPDFLKIWFSPARGMNLAREFTWIRAAIREAHTLGLRVAVHATQLEIARRMVDAGADILVHSIDDRPVDRELLSSMRSRGVLYIPTLGVSRRYAEVLGQQLELTPFERAMGDAGVIASLADLARLYQGYRPPQPLKDNRVARENLLRVHRAGITIAAGSDAGNIGSLHGPGLHRELELMVAAGLSSTDVLLAATRGGAKVMGRSRELGRLESGMLADLLLLDADPQRDIRNTRRIAMVMRGGRIFHCKPELQLAGCPE